MMVERERRTRVESAATRAVLAALVGGRDEWSYGYPLSKASGVASGTLYPILARLTERGLLEARWELEPPRGRPPRHLYRLTQSGRALAQASIASQTVAPKATRCVVKGVVA